MAEKINLSDYFQSGENPADVKVLDSPKDIAEAKEFNRRMKIVRQQARATFIKSRIAARNLILDRSA